MAEGTGLAKRVGAIEPSATVAVTEKAKALRASGVDVIGFGAGEPDFATPAHIVAAAVAAASDPSTHRYSATAGLPELRAAIAAKTAGQGGYPVEAGQVVVSNGGKQILYEVCQALLDPGDEVLVPAPYWVSYTEVIKLAGGVPVAVFAGGDRGFRVDVAQLEEACSDRTRMLVFTSPSNPTGAVYGAEEVEAIGRWAEARGIWVVTDEIYEHLVYGDAEFTSMPAAVPGLRDRCVIVSGVSKTFAMTGWRVGWMVGPQPVAKAVTTLQSHISTNVANVSQRAALAALRGGMEEVAAMRAAFDTRRRTMHRMLSAIPGVDCVEPAGAFYAFPSMRGLLGRPLGEKGSMATTTLHLAEVLLDEAGIAIVPGEAFGAPGYCRLSFAMADDDLVTGLTRLTEFVTSSPA